MEDNKYEQALAKYDTSIDDNQVKKAVESILKHRNENKTPDVMKFLLSCVELTSLKSTDSDESIMALTEKINRFDEEYPELPHVATICVYPCFASIVRDTLQVDGVEIACVSGSFPSSQALIEVKVAETALACKDGATEIDIVMSVGRFLSGDYETVCDEISELKAACGDCRMKVILEVGLIGNMSNVKKAALLSMYSGADFIKTSTGKEQSVAYKTGIRIGFKPAGGLNTIEDALSYYTIVKEVLGKEWLTTEYFRLGTSRLSNLFLSEILEREVNYF